MGRNAPIDAPASPARPRKAMTPSAADGRSEPAIDVRVVLFTVADSRLLVALSANGHDGLRLPRGLPSPAEPLDSAARRIVLEATGVREQYLEQLYSLSIREPPAWTIIVSYMGLVSAPLEFARTDDEIWHDVASLPSLTTADRMVVDYALVRLRAKLGYTNVAFHLLPERFTLSELQETYETILARRLDKRNFRRRMIASGIVVETEEKRREGSHRPATLYRFRPTDDRETYLTPPWAEGA
jgi:8-oxo-dGTP diphosphatase